MEAGGPSTNAAKNSDVHYRLGWLELITLHLWIVRNLFFFFSLTDTEVIPRDACRLWCIMMQYSLIITSDSGLIQLAKDVMDF